ncbi:acyltransferase family protein [Sediminibacillus albus]|uniref:Fucose 4-O-acetylase n=1 Tax=Sediminibacillus albus TaxID=407036 RepID=A0A1G8ZP01_9BACI|nr:acyltransferase family protein [Sediminibacillus albus]SDK16788.1 Fucose 4-O-acetylase [Sediminibacillus albus]
MQRESFFDNAKFLLIFLVVFGHLIQPLKTDSAAVNVIYHWIYIFHMPAFIFLSGFFAKGSGSKGYIVKLSKKLLLPYMIFQVFYTVYYFFIGKGDWMTAPFYPHWSLWFLFSLFCWHLLLHLFSKLSPVKGISAAVMTGLLVGYFDTIGHSFSLSRTFVFFPFFLLGYWITKEKVMQLRTHLVKGVGLLIMVSAAVIISFYPDFSTDWLLGSKSYTAMGAPVFGGVFRLLVYLSALLMSVSVLAWIPRVSGIWTEFGKRTLYVYLLHGFFIQYLRQQELLFYNHPIDIIGFAAIALGIVLLLSNKTMLGLWQPFIEGNASIMKEKFFSNRNKS